MMRPCLSASWCRISTAALFLAFVAGLVTFFHPFVATSRADEEDEAESTLSAPSRVTVKNGLSVLVLNAATQQNGGIETARPTLSPVQESVVGYGTVLDAAQLTDLRNKYLDAQAKVQAAEAKLMVSRGSFDRAQTLYKEQHISEAQLQSAEGTIQEDQAAQASAQATLTATAASAQQAWGQILGKGLIDGAPLIMHLIERRDYLVKVTLPPGVALAKAPETASVKLDTGLQVRLQFISAATATDPKIQGTSYFYDAAAKTDVLPGLNVMVSLHTKEVTEGAVVPQSAVVWMQGKAWVYFRTGADTFVRSEIAPDRSAPNGGYIVTNLLSNAQVAVRGAQVLLSEEFRAQVASAGDDD